MRARTSRASCAPCTISTSSARHATPPTRPRAISSRSGQPWGRDGSQLRQRRSPHQGAAQLRAGQRRRVDPPARKSKVGSSAEGSGTRRRAGRTRGEEAQASRCPPAGRAAAQAPRARTNVLPDVRRHQPLARGGVVGLVHGVPRARARRRARGSRAASASRAAPASPARAGSRELPVTGSGRRRSGRKASSSIPEEHGGINRIYKINGSIERTNPARPASR
jgi:hypothetical protein